MIFILRTSMNIRLTQTFCLLLILCSCKSLQPVTSRNNNAVSIKKKNPQFLDDVSITPGEKKGHNFTYKKSAQQNKNYYENVPLSTFNVEKADLLQIKYAIMMDVSVEQLNDLPLLQQIDHWWGTRYCLGGDDENCIDCSAFTQTLLRNVYGIDVPRTAREQYDFSTHIKDDDLQEGDLVFFKNGHRISHVGLYLVYNKFVNASTSGGVTISDLNDAYWSKRYAGAGRVKPQSISLRESR
jgi:lipoprotein Spr